MITVRFFASLREQLAVSQLRLDDVPASAGALRRQLMQRGTRWEYALADREVLVAVNQVVRDDSCPLLAGDEVAFFPPVTGG